MARYGDLDALEKKLFPFGLVEDGRYAIPAKSVKAAIDNLPIADVAPKREVAREIFEEIYEDCFDQFGYIDYEKLAELKENYTKGDEGK